ncbi:hypothetical protein SNE40_008300 [Patella caerulea]|uniref:Uncharacterized protein n=1 Tax=Patella caerulea TaxID=87958 RepID=A0AAN8K0V8_PATCE
MDNKDAAQSETLLNGEARDKIKDLDIEIEQEKVVKLYYRINDSPIFHLTLLFAVQVCVLIYMINLLSRGKQIRCDLDLIY